MAAGMWRLRLLAFLALSVIACQATTTDNTVDVDGTVAAAVAEALAGQPSPVVVDVSATVEAVVEATVCDTGFEIEHGVPGRGVKRQDCSRSLKQASVGHETHPTKGTGVE